MTPDYRALCAELVELSAPVDSISRLAWRLQQLDRLANRARALLAEPEPEGPTDEELDELFTEIDQSGEALSWRLYARAALARWGRPTPQPVPTSERWPEFSDCDPQERVWAWNPVLDHWKLSRINRSVHTHWLPAHALPLPTPEAADD